MNISLIGQVEAIDIYKQGATLLVRRKTKKGPAAERYQLSFPCDKAFSEFYSYVRVNDVVMLAGDLHFTTTLGEREKVPQHAMVIVRDHRKLPGKPKDYDMAIAWGHATIKENWGLKVRPNGLSYWRGKVEVARPWTLEDPNGKETVGAVAFDRAAELVAPLQQGARLTLDWVGVAMPEGQGAELIIRDLTPLF